MSEQEVRDFVKREINVCIDLWQTATTAKGRRESLARGANLLKHRDKRIAAAAFFRIAEIKFGSPRKSGPGPPGETVESDPE
jgi:hypothetical protein